MILMMNTFFWGFYSMPMNIFMGPISLVINTREVSTMRTIRMSKIKFSVASLHKWTQHVTCIVSFDYTQTVVCHVTSLYVHSLCLYSGRLVPKQREKLCGELSGPMLVATTTFFPYGMCHIGSYIMVLKARPKAFLAPLARISEHTRDGIDFASMLRTHRQSLGSSNPNLDLEFVNEDN